VQQCLERGLDLDRFARRLSFFFVCTSDFLEEVAKFRAARRIWARLMRERFGAQDPESWKLRFHVQTSGHSLTAQSPENNVVRVALQALAAVLGGTQSLHTNAMDEALALPTERSARLALRTQQILAHETGITQVVDPLGGAYAIERMTLDLEAAVEREMKEVERLGGAIAAVTTGYYKRKIVESAVRWQREVDEMKRVIVGVNRFGENGAAPIRMHRVTGMMVAQQLRRLRGYKARRGEATGEQALARLEQGAEGRANLLPLIKAALRAKATLGEISDALRHVFGEYRAPFVS
jgi:methylmalonyl-CoA mutase N-terminal domain/subunit